MTLLEISFWCAAAFIFYTYLFYPLCVALLARCFGRPVRFQEGWPASVSFLVPVFNEEAVIARRLEELRQYLANSGRQGEILVICDGCTDATAARARAVASSEVQVLELVDRQGKAAALMQGRAVARYDILVLADARQQWAADALEKLLRNFADPAVGAVSGDLLLASRADRLEGVRCYWNYEKWLRRQESRLHSCVGVTGAISAVRRSLFPTLPPGTLVDDLYWPLKVVLQGYRVVHEPEARAFDQLPAEPRQEFRRKVRTLSGNFQLLSRLPQAFFPWRNPIWWQLVSHKLCRLLVPWALLWLLLSSALLARPTYWLLFALQGCGYLLGLATLLLCRRPPRLFAVLASFLTLHAAAWLAFWVWLSGRAERSWTKVAYQTSSPS